MSKVELKNCPFCGGEAEVILIPNRFIDNEYIVCCSSISCAIRPKTNRFRCEKKAIEAWNTRKPMEAVISELVELRKQGYCQRVDMERCSESKSCIECYEETLREIVRGKE